MVSTGQIVRWPVKVDFHIHSAASAHKDGQKVKDGTVENIDVLFERLEKNGVNMTAITDHDAFDYGAYDALRHKVDGARHLQKVLPGVEFTVSFKTNEGSKSVHVVTLFDDRDQESVRRISNAIPSKNGRPDYDDGCAFTEDAYWNIIREIGLDIVAIAHQKASLGSKRARTNDANSVGEDLYNEFLFVEYFEAYEYKNRRNELFNKNYAYSHDQQEQLRFITGSDCHVWSVYPNYDMTPSKTDSDFIYTYLKCLPTFKGLAMAVTDISRIKTVPSFFSGSTKMIGGIEITLGDEDLTIPLSPGINAIIGDNSIGKSSLLNALNGFTGIGAQAKKGQEKYLKSMGLSLRETIPDGYLLCFDGQEAIRKSFEGLSAGKARKQLDRHFPDPIDPAPFKQFAMGQFNRYLQALQKSCEYQEALKLLSDCVIPEKRPLEAPESVTFVKEVKLDDASPHNGLIDAVKTSRVQLSNANGLHQDVLTGEDKKDFCTALDALARIIKRHQAVVNRIHLDARIANKVEEAVTKRETAQSQVITDAQKAQGEYRRSIDRIGNSIARAVMCEQRLRDFTFDFESMPIDPRTNPVGELQFVCKLGVSEITPKLLASLIDSLIGKSKSIDTLTSSYETVIDAINNYPDDEEAPLSVLTSKFENALDAKLKPAKSIIREGDDVYDELSQGYNAQMYFALMADSSMGDGIYIVDQPEDQISQKAIRESVLREFRAIAGSRQVILITHNPQFIVNLDVDNVIFIGKKDGSLSIRSGALEYECDEYSILETVADNIEGGLDTIKRRMKRYEKAN